jgi:hypothetical protein
MFSQVMTIVLISATGASAAASPGVAKFVRDHRLARYSVALTDLNGDGRAEALVYAMDSAGGRGGGLCGSGGCNLYVLALTAKGYRQVADIAITRPPIGVLPTMAHGWHDLAVRVAGGGIIPGHEARLRFDGRSYPSNPTVRPATRLEHGPGKVVIGSLPPALQSR